MPLRSRSPFASPTDQDLSDRLVEYLSGATPQRRKPIVPFIRDAELKQYKPTLRDRIGDIVLGGSKAIGAANPQMNRMVATGILADVLPGVGDAIGIQEAKNDFNRGDYFSGVVGSAATAAGLIPGVGDLAGRGIKAGGEAVQKGIRAFHGSPHDFDKFSLDKIGTGEGAQAYGHGLYFAENEGVARSYRDALADDVLFDGKPVGSVLAASNDLPEGAYDAIRVYAGTKGNLAEAIDELEWQKTAMPAIADGAQKNIEWLKKNVDQLEYRPGSMFEVNINANPEDFLDWDKPLSEQPEKVMQIYDDYGAGDSVTKFENTWIAKDPIHGWSHHDTEKEARKALADRLTGRDLHNSLEQIASNKDASGLVSSQGIPGIKYLDQGSRGAGEGSRNYVVFDDSLIDIVKKYGIVAAIGAGILTQQQADQMIAQGDIDA